jgi:NADH:ubiquinone oxidoreductase subunit K
MNGIVLASLLFCLGLYGVLTRRELVAVLASVEVMLGGATLLLVSLAASYRTSAMATAGEAYAIVLLAVVAAEAAVGLALLVALVRHGKANVDEIGEVRG